MRIVNRGLALLFSLALILSGAVLVIEITAHQLGNDPVVVDWPAAVAWAQHTTWSATPVRLISGALAVIGIALLLAQLKPRRRARVAVTAADPATDVAITRRGLAYSLATAVGRVEGVHAPHVVVKRRKIKIGARTRRGPTADLAARREAVARAAQQRLDTLRLRTMPGLVVHLTSRGR